MSQPAGFGPFDSEMPVGLTEYGGGAGLIEGSPTSQSAKEGKRGEGVDHVVSLGAEMSAAEKIGVAYRTDSNIAESPIDPVSGLTTDDVG